MTAEKSDSNKIAAFRTFDGPASRTYDENSTKDELTTETQRHREDQIEDPFI